jgi:hypothetical protein
LAETKLQAAELQQSLDANMVIFDDLKAEEACETAGASQSANASSQGGDWYRRRSPTTASWLLASWPSWAQLGSMLRRSF